MERYWLSRPRPRTRHVKKNTDHVVRQDSFTSEYDQHRRNLISEQVDIGWQSELRLYLKDVPEDVDADTDIIAWWPVRTFSRFIFFYFQTLNSD